MAGVVESVNVGAPREIRWRGPTVSPAVWKAPVRGRVRVRGVNVEGDRQANLEAHGGVDKALYAYAAEDQEWWGGELGREVPPGSFGENLTLRGIDISGALVGERWLVGGTPLGGSRRGVPRS